MEAVPGKDLGWLRVSCVSAATLNPEPPKPPKPEIPSRYEQRQEKIELTEEEKAKWPAPQTRGYMV